MNVTVDRTTNDMAVSHEKAFLEAFRRTMKKEGFYSDDPIDPGGETFKGISRHWHPTWPGWRIIEQCGPHNIPDYILTNLDALVEVFYRDQFWSRIHGNKLSELSQPIANKIFDTAVNKSVHSAVEWLQDALSLLNRNALLYPDLIVDGKLGPVTLGRLELYLITRPGTRGESEKLLLNVYSFLQGGYYIEQMRRYPQKEKYRGWFDRAADLGGIAA